MHAEAESDSDQGSRKIAFVLRVATYAPSDDDSSGDEIVQTTHILCTMLEPLLVPASVWTCEVLLKMAGHSGS